MATNFPTSIDALTNPTATDTVAAVDHAAQHANANDAIEALEAKVGVNSSVVTSSHDYKLSGITGSDKASSLAGSETLTNKTLTTPTIGSFANATHTHTNSAGGGQLTDAALSAAVSVSKGGTGATSLTAYAPVFGGTTSTGVVQSGTVGSSGQVLTSNGAGALPTFQDAGGLTDDQLLVATVNLSSSDITNMNATPVTLIAAPGAGKVTIVDQVIVSFDYNSVQYTNGGDYRFVYAAATSDNIMSTLGDGNMIRGAVDALHRFGTGAAGTTIIHANSAIQITNATSAFASGNSTAKVFLRYRIITL